MVILWLLKIRMLLLLLFLYIMLTFVCSLRARELYTALCLVRCIIVINHILIYLMRSLKKNPGHP